MQATIELPDAQAEALARLCRRENISQEEAIQLAVDRLVASEVTDGSPEDDAQRKENFKAGFGAWRGFGIDSRAYVDELRAEWDERPFGKLP